jgi:uncharacterized membrane protein
MNEEQKILAALSYVLWPVALVVLLVEEAKEEHKSRQLRHHGFNALGFWIAALLIGIPVSVLTFVPIIGTVIAALFIIALIALALLFAIRAYRDEKIVVPYVTAFLKRNIRDF